MNGKNFEYLDWLYNDTSGKRHCQQARLWTYGF